MSRALRSAMVSQSIDVAPRLLQEDHPKGEYSDDEWTAVRLLLPSRIQAGNERFVSRSRSRNRRSSAVGSPSQRRHRLVVCAKQASS